MTQTTRYEAPAEQVWRTCEYLRHEDGKTCKKCPMKVDHPKHGPGFLGCVLMAQEIINVVETGNPWRDGRPWP